MGKIEKGRENHKRERGQKKAEPGVCLFFRRTSHVPEVGEATGGQTPVLSLYRYKMVNLERGVLEHICSQCDRPEDCGCAEEHADRETPLGGYFERPGRGMREIFHGHILSWFLPCTIASYMPRKNLQNLLIIGIIEFLSVS